MANAYTRTRTEAWDMPTAIAMFEAGKTLASIAKHFGVTTAAMCYRFDHSGYVRARRFYPKYATEEERQEAIKARNRRYTEARKARRNACITREEQEAGRARNRKYRLGEAYQQNAEARNTAAKSRYRELRYAAVAAYGGKCVCCGEDHTCFLTIDHVHNDGAQHRAEMGSRSGSHFYQWLKRNGFPQDGRFQVLCFSCNFAKAMDPVGHRIAHPNAIHIDGLGDCPQPTRTARYKIKPDTES